MTGWRLTARNASVEDMVALLRGRQARKVDVVAPAAAIRAEGGLIVLDRTVPVIRLAARRAGPHP